MEPQQLHLCNMMQYEYSLADGTHNVHWKAAQGCLPHIVEASWFVVALLLSAVAVQYVQAVLHA